MEIGSSVEAGGYSFTLQSLTSKRGPNYNSTEGLVFVYNSAQEQVATLRPEKRLYRVQRMPMTEASIDEGLFRDLYVAMGEPIENSNAWAMRIYYKPFVLWLWLGVLFMAIGGILAAADPRYRRMAKQLCKNTKQS